MLTKQSVIWFMGGLSIMLALSSCQKNEQHQPINQDNTSTTKPITTQTDKLKKIDWQLLATDIPPVSVEKFNYPFQLDSEPVKIYAQSYQLDNQTARHHMTVGMASNELLSKLLDQLGENYVSHEMTTDKNPIFVVHTTPNVEPTQGKYIFSDPFAKGLSIDVKIVNDGIKKSLADLHEMDKKLTKN
ncbi:hypothetical protein MOMA_06386 [Moraxella macacae 0408225]|uniref:Lipoprotein n=1 Tax=Moraxella macacae 0408225 TaxID=1230338 RepID=L2F572_9GAMM|nr:hypothetical protein [Moraxella macacae]ELA08167.1 hypothetical protein MOMA_06386 [Moraxella macacae 0408225]